jgi:hypothetical protein
MSEIYNVFTIPELDSKYHVDPNCPTLTETPIENLQLVDYDNVPESQLCGTCQRVFLE